jgi:prepilin peptidase CpaA
MPPAFFPLPGFAWAFYVILVGLLAIAAVTEFRHLIIPKWLTLGTLGLGVLANLVRGAWLGAAGVSVWQLDGHWALGLLDGLLFSLAGLAIGFALFFVMWLLGICGGGDVKLIAAVGAWLGPVMVVAVLGGTLVVVLFVTLGQLVRRLLGGGMSALRTASPSARKPGQPLTAKDRKRRLLSYSLPVALTVAVLLPWIFRVELQLAQPKVLAIQGRTPPHAP